MKSIFIWKGSACYGGDLGVIAERLQHMGIKRVFVKIGDASWNHSRSFIDMRTAVTALRVAIPGVEVWGWHYVYGGAYLDKLGRARFDWHSPESEALFAIAETQRLSLDGYCIDAEREYKLTGPTTPRQRALRFINTLRPLARSVPIAFSSYRYPSLHPELPWSAFLGEGVVSLHMPQVYWGNYQGAPTRELERSMRELRIQADLPFHPIGRAYIGDGHSGYRPARVDVISSEILEFVAAADKLQTHGVSFWVLDAISSYGPQWADAIAAAGPAPVPVPPPLMERWRCFALLGMVVRDRPSRTGNDTGARIKFNEVFWVYEIVFNDSLTWGRIDPTESKWIALNWSRKEN